MNISEFESLLQQSDLAFVEAIETEAFQSMLEHDFSFYIALDEGLRWRLLYGLWVVLLDFSEDPDSPWKPSKVTIPGLPTSLCLADLLQALVVADFEVNAINWWEEPCFDPAIDEQVYSSSLHSQGCRQLVEHQIEAGLRRVLACDFSSEPAAAVERRPGLFMRILSALIDWAAPRRPRVRHSDGSCTSDSPG